MCACSLRTLIWQQYTGELYSRYIGGVGFTDVPVSELEDFIEFCSNFHPSIKLTSHISTSSVNFLAWTLQFW